MMFRYWAARNTCPKCSYRWTNDLKSQVMNLRKVDFFWINREQRSFEWFISLLSQLEIEQAEQGGAMERFLDMHMYITSALQKTDMKAVGLQLALELLHEKVKISHYLQVQLLKIFNYIKLFYPAVRPSCPGPLKTRH